MEPTPTIDWSSSYTHTYLYNAENHSAIIITSTYNDDLNTHMSAVYILHLESFALTAIKNPNQYEMFPTLVEHGYFVFSVRDTRLSYFPWIEVYDYTGKMISTSENEVRAAPKTEDSYYSLQHSLGVAFCDFSVSINSSGEIIKNGQYENRYYDNCNNFVNVSENGIYGFTLSNYSFSLHDVNQNKVEEIRGYSPWWIGNSIAHWTFIDGGGERYLRVMRIPSQESIELHSPEIAGGDLYTSGKYILLTQKNEHLKPARLQLYTEDLQLIYDSAQF